MAKNGNTQDVPRHLAYHKSNIPLIGALIDYIDTSFEYFRKRTFTRAERLHIKATKASLSPTFVSIVCLLLGLVCNVKFEVVTIAEESLSNDLHFMLMSKDDKLYVEDIDVTRVIWCIEASDALLILISVLLIWNSSFMRWPLSEYQYLPWLGATLRGLFLRQAPTAGALVYTMVVVNGNVNPLFLTSFTLLFLLEARLWLEIARLQRARWQRCKHSDNTRQAHSEVRTLWSNDDAQSVEVGNFVY